MVVPAMKKRDFSQSKEKARAKSRGGEGALKPPDCLGTLTDSHGLGDRGCALGKLDRGPPCEQPGPGERTPQGKCELKQIPSCKGTQPYI